MSFATFAGGCFWCMEPEFYSVPGVTKVICGYIGGHVVNPTYEQVCQGTTGHVEAIQITYDKDKITYEKLLDIFWKNIDPFDGYGQFVDKGTQYQAGIFFHDNNQKVLAELSREKIQKIFTQPVASFIKPATAFYPAEDYHQEFFIKSRERYKQYSTNNGRKMRLQEIWKEK
ncbi:MAG: peptide-methionine (S)-S-oxide reductase MsrA [Alphaproteobacteria bacterium]|nr:peptide-methionine (S)-S-oxide reductase MsrA [Alphaproteobacteria bacterium]